MGTTKEMPGNYPLEDLALKTAAQYFGKEILPYLGVREKLQAVAPAEIVHLEARQMYQDFNYVLEDGSWLHLEFESDAVTDEDFRRFREYEATTARTHKVAVTTCVVCSSSAKHIRSELNMGLNTYKVRVLRLKDQDADKVLKRCTAKMEKGQRLKKKDMITAVMTPLMSGRSSQKERIISLCRLLKAEQEEGTSRDDMEKLQAMMYAFAVKFLSKDELQSVKEVLNMTVLGQMIWDDGVNEGLRKGELKKTVLLMCKKLKKGQSVQVIAEALEEEPAYIENLCKVVQEYAPGYDEEARVKRLMSD